MSTYKKKTWKDSYSNEHYLAGQTGGNPETKEKITTEIIVRHQNMHYEMINGIMNRLDTIEKQIAVIQVKLDNRTDKK